MRKKTTMKIVDYVAVNKIADRIAISAGKDREFDWYIVVLRVGKSRFVLTDEDDNQVEIRAVTKYLAKQEAIQVLAMGGWSLVNDDALVMEVERVYETRIDCPIEPEGVRQLAAWMRGD